MKKFITIITSFSVLLCSCQKEPIFPAVDEDSHIVPVRISFNVSDEECSMDTKAFIDDDDEPVTIANLYVLQFDGTEDASKLILSRYIDDMDTNGGNTIELIESNGANTILFLANACTKAIDFSRGKSLGEIKKMLKSAPGKDIDDYVLGAEGDDRYPILNGSCTPASIKDGTSLQCELKRNVARLDIKVINSVMHTPVQEGDVIIDSLVLRNIPSHSHYFTNMEGFLEKTVPQDGAQFLDCNTVKWSERMIEEDGKETVSLRYYVPSNMQGVMDNNDEKSKTTFAPSNATHLFIYAHYKDGDGWSAVNYTFVLGEDLIKDCNLKPNHKYSYTFDITAKGDSTTDGRVQDWGTVDFTSVERANCYILNPPILKGDMRGFRIPVDRIKTFWCNDDKSRMYENVEQNALEGNTRDYPWRVDIEWSDFKTDDSKFKFTKQEGTGNSDYFEVQVGNGVSGNVLVKIRRYRYKDKKDGELIDEVLWSWHLWITDYKPDDILSATPTEGKYTYYVTGGEAHRYSNSAFISGLYKNSFIMDRHLGARSISERNWFLAYQFGRKDPFPRAITKGALTGKAKVFDGEGNSIEHSNTTDSNNCNLSYSVNNPFTVMETGSNWISSSHEDYTQYAKKTAASWNDPYTTASKGEKSIFDPCPPGWCIPNVSAWEGMHQSFSGANTYFVHPYESGKDLPDTFNYPAYPISDWGSSMNYAFNTGSAAAANNKINETNAMHLKGSYNPWSGGSGLVTTYTACKQFFPVRCVKTP